MQKNHLILHFFVSLGIEYLSKRTKNETQLILTDELLDLFLNLFSTGNGKKLVRTLVDRMALPVLEETDVAFQEKSNPIESIRFQFLLV